jgi:hypothetical protein
MAGTISPIYDAEAEALKRQMAFANTLRDKGMQGNTGSGYQGGRVYIVGNPLGNIASSIGGAILANRAEEGQRGLEQRMGQERQDWLNALPSSTTELEGPTQTGEALTGLKAAKQRAQEMQQWAMGAPRGMEGVQQFALQQALTAPQREEEARQRAADRNAELAAKYAELRAAQQERLQQQFENQKTLKEIGLQNAMALKAMGGGGSSKPDMRIVDTVDENGNPVKQVIDLNAMQPGQTLGKYVTPKAPSAAAQKAQIEANIGIANIDRAIELIDERPGSLGTRHKIPGMETISQFTDPEGVPARAAVSNVGSLKLHDRSGAAVTISEFPRLAPFIPSPGDKPEVAKSKLSGLKREYETIRDEWARGTNTSILGGSRPKTPTAPTKPVPAAAPGQWDADKEARYLEWKARQGK